MKKTATGALCLLCVAYVGSGDQVSARAAGAHEKAIYETSGLNGQYAGNAIQISKNSVEWANSTAFFVNGGHSDLGGIHYWATEGGHWFSSIFPIFISKEPNANWSRRGYRCSASGSSLEIVTVCIDADGTKYASLFHRVHGLLWLDFFCDSHVDEICRFKAYRGKGFQPLG